MPVPPVIGQSYDSASAELQSQDFAVARRDVESEQPEGTVVSQDPAANELVARGTTVILGVSRGPQLSTVPDVTGLDASTAEATLENAGFGVSVQTQETNDPNQDGVVFDQDPFGGTEAAPGTTVTIIVGEFAAETETQTETETVPTTTAEEPEEPVGPPPPLP